jgi:hypothetical protein
MTERKIQYSLKRVHQCREKGCYNEALQKMYHLNAGLLRYISDRVSTNAPVSKLKPSELIEQLIVTVESRPNLRSVIAKKNLKSLRPWASRMDDYFKTLKRREPSNTKLLLKESENVLAILKISTSKLIVSFTN